MRVIASKNNIFKVFRRFKSFECRNDKNYISPKPILIIPDTILPPSRCHKQILVDPNLVCYSDIKPSEWLKKSADLERPIRVLCFRVQEVF